MSELAPFSETPVTHLKHIPSMPVRVLLTMFSNHVLTFSNSAVDTSP